MSASDFEAKAREIKVSRLCEEIDLVLCVTGGEKLPAAALRRALQQQGREWWEDLAKHAGVNSPSSLTIAAVIDRLAPETSDVSVQTPPSKSTQPPEHGEMPGASRTLENTPEQDARCGAAKLASLVGALQIAVRESDWEAVPRLIAAMRNAEQPILTCAQIRLEESGHAA